MTIEQFAKIKGKKKKLVVSWVKNGLIPGASLEKNYIPDSARIPYTKARAKTSKARYVSMVRASEGFYHILPQLYGICKEEFDAYVQRLVDAGLIARRNTDGVDYYDTVYDSSQTDNFILKAIEKAAKVIIEGATTAIIKNIM
ncbi:MAG: hypothetical protein IKA90_05990 [Clostridia bacterium]|nr:hypothetical protein [Clostridia bacterium]